MRLADVPLTWGRLHTAVLALILASVAATGVQIGKAVEFQEEGQLVYEMDEQGNRLPDFSAAGYGGGGVALPETEVKVVVRPVEGDDGSRIQSAIDYVSGLPVDASGMRGTVQLVSGQYEIEESLNISTSGVVLSGNGQGPEETVLVATGTDRRALIRVNGSRVLDLGKPVPVADEYVPVGSLKVRIRGNNTFKVGDRVRITRPSPMEWIREIGMDTAPARTHYAWKADKVDISWERTIADIKGKELLLDAPLTTALEARLGGAVVRRLNNTGRIRNVGITHLNCISHIGETNPMDEEHAWMAIHMDHVEDAWVANVTARHFVSSAVYLGSGTRRITVQDCRSLDPVSEVGGYRRQAFRTDGQQTLFLRCTSDRGINDFTVGYLATGPNVFLGCRADNSHGMSGSIGSWASGILFDNVHIDGGSLALDNLEVAYGGVGWAAANSVLWQSSASRVVCRSPAGALNWAIGVWGQFWGDGRWQASNEFVKPQSLYRAQLAERLGAGALVVLDPLPGLTGCMQESLYLESLEIAASSDEGHRAKASPMRLENGILVNDNGPMGGLTVPASWWRGHLLPARSGEHHTALTRFLPGRIGDGATNDLQAVGQEMVNVKQGILRHHWGLWYDRRREDHQMIRRDTATVWPPFYEQPWARSGQGTAWDGLSRYDLTRFNPWYFKRLSDFADVALEQGLVFFNEMYFQHNILESGAHWVDFPWRPVNAIQDTGFTEPPPFTGDTIKMADEFYDTSHPLRRELHQAYIRKCLDNLAGKPNVIHTIGAEYSGPLHFVEFWLDVIKEWIQETGNNPMIALSVPKDVQDAILEDPERSPLVDIIEFKYWWYAGEKNYAPKGGENLAPRQHLRRWRGGRPTASDVYRMVQEYRDRYPEKAVVFPSNDRKLLEAAHEAGASLSTTENSFRKMETGK